MKTKENNEVVIQTTLINLKKELDETLGLQAKHDGQNQIELTLTTFKITVRDFVHSKVQPVHDTLLQLLLPHIQSIPSTEFAEKTQKTFAKNESLIKEKEHQSVQVEGRKNAIVLDPLKWKYSLIFLGVAFLAGAADGANSYNSLIRYYPLLTALISAGMIGAVVAFGHHFYSGWIQRSATRVQRYIKIAVVLSIAFGFFYWVSVLRVQANQDAIAISSAVDVASPHLPIMQYSPLAACCISFLLFAAVFFLSLNFWRSKQERLEYDEHAKLSKELNQLKDEIARLKTENQELETSLTEHKNIRSTSENLLKNSLQQAKNIGESAMKLYKHTYARFHGSVPDFFEDDFTISYADSLIS